MKRMINLNDLMQEQLRNMYEGETLFAESLAKIKEEATNYKLIKAIATYQENNDDQVLRLKQVFNYLYTQKRGEKCEAVKAMIKEAEDIITRSMAPEIKDASIITALQHIIHYQIAGYGAICNYANLLDLEQVAALMHKNLEEEKRADKLLVQLAEAEINPKAAPLNSNFSL